MINTVILFLFKHVLLRTKDVYCSYAHGIYGVIIFPPVYYFLLVVIPCTTIYIPLWKGTTSVRVCTRTTVSNLS